MSTESSTASAASASTGDPTVAATSGDSSGAVFVSPYNTISMKTHVPMGA